MASTRKPPLGNNASNPLNRRSMPPSAPSATRGSSRSPTPNSNPSSAAPSLSNGISRRNTLRDRDQAASGSTSNRNSISSPYSARSAAKRPPSISTDAELENAAILEDLRSRLAQAESTAEAATEEYAKEMKGLQVRLDEARNEQFRMEDLLHVKEEFIENLEIQIKELTRAKRDQENIYEAERTAAQQEKEEMLDREEELNTIIHRLKATLSQRDRTSDSESRTSLESPSDESPGFAPPSNVLGPNRANNLLLQKDKLIESLRLELAEAQIRLVEADHQGGTKLHQLEQQLHEARVTNARLMEDNESFQLLLSSAALNGDFPRGDYNDAFSEADPEPEHVVKKVQGSPRNSISLGSNLAEELEEAVQSESERYRKIELELKSLKEQNKAMSLYINNIIERILQHGGSEAILDKTASLNDFSTTTTTGTDKALPPPPPRDEEPAHGKILQRTKSLASRSTTKPKSPLEGGGATLTRSQTMRAPLGTHKRSQSDAHTLYPGASVINSLYRGEGVITSRSHTFYGNEQFSKGSRPRNSDLSLDSTTSDVSDSNPPPPPSRHVSSPTPPTAAMGPIAGNKLRPLRLVQENVGTGGLVSPPLAGGVRNISGDYKDGVVEDDKSKLEKRQSKRSSWIPWFNRTKEDQESMIPNYQHTTTTNGTTENILFERKDAE